ncbi:MAG: helix-turn-helix domain-containing protein [Candidatus Omnitrophota bacterium]|nr:helix-turn-helix domain-containing protein [Candidatus Omnitrophota bacterium]MBU1929582.1 helix-turn-helix domain-containing protein [Candidatus Omnitrophota bacterium]MBU2034988.1 helix-turn-helix domain-containing protein [Candidatus Omnitrophota bacterium]
MQRLMSIEELASYLQLQRQTIYNWLNQGKISGIKVGGVWRFDRRDVDAWLKSRKSAVRTGDTA